MRQTIDNKINQDNRRSDFNITLKEEFYRVGKGRFFKDTLPPHERKSALSYLLLLGYEVGSIDDINHVASDIDSVAQVVGWINKGNIKTTISILEKGITLRPGFDRVYPGDGSFRDARRTQKEIRAQLTQAEGKRREYNSAVAKDNVVVIHDKELDSYLFVSQSWFEDGHAVDRIISVLQEELTKEELEKIYRYNVKKIYSKLQGILSHTLQLGSSLESEGKTNFVNLQQQDWELITRTNISKIEGKRINMMSVTKSKVPFEQMLLERFVIDETGNFEITALDPTIRFGMKQTYKNEDLHSPKKDAAKASIKLLAKLVKFEWQNEVPESGTDAF